MDSTIEPGATADSGREQAGSPVTGQRHAQPGQPPRRQPGGDRHAEACPYRAGSGYPGDGTNGRRIPGEPDEIGAMTIAVDSDNQRAATIPVSPARQGRQAPELPL